jgi:hypothetical protein
MTSRILELSLDMLPMVLVLAALANMGIATLWPLFVAIFVAYHFEKKKRAKKITAILGVITLPLFLLEIALAVVG